MKITLVIAVALANVPKGVSEAKIQEKVEAGLLDIFKNEGFGTVTLEGGVIEATFEDLNPDLTKIPKDLLEDPTEPVQLDLFTNTHLEAEGNTSDV